MSYRSCIHKEYHFKGTCGGVHAKAQIVLCMQYKKYTDLLRTRDRTLFKYQYEPIRWKSFRDDCYLSHATVESPILTCMRAALMCPRRVGGWADEWMDR